MKYLRAIRSFAHLATAALAVAALLPSSASGDWSVNAGASSTAGVGQDILITLKQDPRANPEATCLAVTLARSLRGDFSPPEAPPTGANVTLFPTLDGVVIGDAHVVSRPPFRCRTPGVRCAKIRFRCATPEGVISLEENLEDFLCDTGDRDDCPDGPNMNNLVECPLCWTERYGKGVMPDYGVLDPQAVGAVLLNADKVIDF